MNEIIGPFELSISDWTDKGRQHSLGQVYEKAMAKAGELKDYYKKSMGHKKNWSRGLRYSQIALITLLGIGIPITLFMQAYGWTGIVSGSLTAVIVAIGLIDHFGSFSGTWMRQSKAFQQISALVDEFEINWAKKSCDCGGDFNESHAKEALDLIKSFVRQVDSVAIKETTAWIAEMNRALRDLDKRAADLEAKEKDRQAKELADQAKSTEERKKAMTDLVSNVSSVAQSFAETLKKTAGMPNTVMDEAGV